jgi:hypothetical protein
MSKLRIEKLKQGTSSNNDVLVYRNDIGTYQGQSNLTLTAVTVSANATVGNLNTTGTVTANVLSVSNVAQTQTNLQVDPAGSAFLNAIIYG